MYIYIYIFFENGSFRENNKYVFIYNHVKVCSTCTTFKAATFSCN